MLETHKVLSAGNFDALPNAVLSATWNFDALLNANVVEALGFHLTIKFAHDMGFCNTLVEGDSLKCDQDLEVV